MTFGVRKSLRARGSSFPAAVIEACESRRLLSHGHAAASAAIVEGVLQVMGTRGQDEILVALNGDTGQIDVTNWGAPVQSFDPALVTNGIEMFGGTGRDRLSVLKTMTTPAKLWGGEGKDTLNGAAGNDMLDGDEGKDALTGGDGADSISGGRGNDVIYGLTGDDTLSGGKGHDVLMGGADDDTLAGGADDDSVTGGDGDDLVEGGSGDDDVDGGTGTDDVIGEDGHDTFHDSDDVTEHHDEGDDDVLKTDDDSVIV
jgi:Ca2+-binding RTX toxin-like protein